MQISKKTAFFLGLSALLVPFLMTYTPFNSLDYQVLKIENDEKVEDQTFDFPSFFGDTAVVDLEDGRPQKVENGWNTREEMIGDFFANKEKLANQSFGLRPLYLKLRNQIDFSLFNKANAKSVILGKDGYLFEERYIEAYYGRDFIGQDSIDERVAKLRFVQDELAKLGKLVFVVLAPSKGSFYPEKIPQEYHSKKTTTNYEGYLKAFKAKGINYIDFSAHFLAQKETSKHVLYPKTGIHWSQYGMYYATDSMLNYVESKMNIDLPDVVIEDREPIDDVRFKDNDIETGLNLFFKLDHPKMTYPKFSFTNPEGKDRPRILTISDSFYWQMYNLGISNNVFKEGQFWFYNQTVHPDSDLGNGYVFTHQRNLYNELRKTDIVMLMATEANLYKFCYDFIEKSNTALKVGIESYEKRVKEIELKIRQTPDWFEQVANKSRERGIPLEDMLRMDAEYVYDVELKQNN